MKGDPRGYRVAVVADSRLQTLLPLLEEEGWGVIQLPPAGLDEETAALWLEQVSEHVAEFRRNDYAVVLLGDGLHDPELGLPALGDEDPRPFLRRHATRPAVAPET